MHSYTPPNFASILAVYHHLVHRSQTQGRVINPPVQVTYARTAPIKTDPHPIRSIYATGVTARVIIEMKAEHTLYIRVYSMCP